MSFIYSFEFNIVVLPDPKIFLWIAASVADAAVVNFNGIQTLLGNDLSIFFIKSSPIFSRKSLPKNLPDCLILCNWVFHNFKLADELFAKALQNLETFVLFNYNFCRKLFSLLESSSLFFFPGFNLFSYELNKFTFKVLLYRVILFLYYLKVKWIYNTFTGPCGNLKLFLPLLQQWKILLCFLLYLDFQ